MKVIDCPVCGVEIAVNPHVFGGGCPICSQEQENELFGQTIDAYPWELDDEAQNNE